MIDVVKRQLVRILRDTADKIDVGNSEIEEEQALEIMKLIAHEPISKERAAIEIKLSPSRFDALIAEGKLPKGHKKLGFKEKRFYLDEVIEYAKKYKIGKYK